jgi:hypothetical protein
MHVELSAVKGLETDSINTCNENVEDTEAFAVYISNPLAYHVHDFKVLDYHSFETDRPEWRISAYNAASQWAAGLAKHLGCDIEIRCKI